MALDPVLLERIPAFLERSYLEPGRLPCAQLLVLHRGERVFESVQGHADIARGRRLEADHIFRIYSMTKPISAVALMMLVEEGRLALDDPVHRYIPAWRTLGVYRSGTLKTGFRTVPPQRPMTVLDLMRHTAGLTYGFQLSSNVDAAYRRLGIGEIEKGEISLGQMIERLAELPLEFSPGEAWNYSVATDVVGWLVQLVSGQPFEDYVATRILNPCGMADTGFHVPEARAHRLTSCYQPGEDGRLCLQDDAAISSFLKPPTFVSGGGGLVSTAADYARFAEALRTGRPRLIGRKTLELMTANHLPGGQDLPAVSRSAFSEAQYEGAGYGLGFGTTIDPVRSGLTGSRGDWYWGGVASTFFWVDPSEELTVVFLSQLIPSSTWPVRRQLRTMVYAAVI